MGYEEIVPIIVGLLMMMAGMMLIVMMVMAGMMTGMMPNHDDCRWDDAHHDDGW